MSDREIRISPARQQFIRDRVTEFIRERLPGADDEPERNPFISSLVLELIVAAFFRDYRATILARPEDSPENQSTSDIWYECTKWIIRKFYRNDEDEYWRIQSLRNPRE